MNEFLLLNNRISLSVLANINTGKPSQDIKNTGKAKLCFRLLVSHFPQTARYLFIYLRLTKVNKSTKANDDTCRYHTAAKIATK